MKKFAGSNSPYFYPGEPVQEGNMRVTVLGSGTPLPRRGQASPCILVEAGGDNILLDIGPGGPANLASLEIPLPDADKVIVTHHHVDHIGALDQLWIAGWTFGRGTPLRLWGPPGTERIAELFEEIYQWDVSTRNKVLPPEGAHIDANDYEEGLIYDENGVTVNAFKVVHTVPHNSYGLRVEYEGRSLVFAGDTKKCQSLIDNAQNADVIIHEAFPPLEIYMEKTGRPREMAVRVAEEFHTAPREAGAVFAETNPRLGVIYHLYNNEDIIIPAVDQLRETYSGRIEIAQDLMVIDIGDEIKVRPAIVGDKPWPVQSKRN